MARRERARSAACSARVPPSNRLRLPLLRLDRQGKRPDALSTQSTSEPDVVNGIRELSEFIASVEGRGRGGCLSARGEGPEGARSAQVGAGCWETVDGREPRWKLQQWETTEVGQAEGS